MARSRLSSMWWRRCRGLIHCLHSGENLNCVGLSNIRAERNLETAFGRCDLRTLRSRPRRPKNGCFLLRFKKRYDLMKQSDGQLGLPNQRGLQIKGGGLVWSFVEESNLGTATWTHRRRQTETLSRSIQSTRGYQKDFLAARTCGWPLVRHL